MKPGFSIFLLVTEEMSISKAAQRAFVTQQCVSDHIRRLENEYKVTLFERKPHMKLTQAGEIMLHTLRSVSILEQNMEDNLKGIASGVKGAFTVGISTSRAQILLPRILPHYRNLFPEVDIYFYVNDTVVLEQHLLEGKIDLLLGVNASSNPNFSSMPLPYDYMRLVISHGLLSRHFNCREIESFSQGVDVSRFTDVPFVLYNVTGAVNKVISRYLETHRLKLITNYYISDCDTHIALCASGMCAALCPKMLLARIDENNMALEPDRRILVFPIQQFDEALRIDFVWHQHITLPHYMDVFMNIVREELELLANI